MSEVKKYDHSIVNHPGDEGSLSSEQGKTYDSADCANEAAPLGGSHEVVHRPGNEGSEFPQTGMLADVTMGYQNPPGAPLDQFLQGPEVRRTRVMPATNANADEAMPGAE
jgi:hypothetical protein